MCGESVDSVVSRLHDDLEIILNWVSYNGMVANPDKFQAIFLGTKNDSIVLKVGSSSIESSKCVKLLGITIDNQLTFYPHILEICKKASSKSKALLRIRNYLRIKSKQIFSFLHTLCLHLTIVPWYGCSAVNGHTILFAQLIIKHSVPDSILLLIH